MASLSIRGILNRNPEISPNDLDFVIFGNVIQGTTTYFMVMMWRAVDMTVRSKTENSLLSVSFYPPPLGCSNFNQYYLNTRVSNP